MIVTVSWKEWLEDINVRRMASAEDAARYVDALPNDRTAFVFDTDKFEWLAAGWTYGTGQLAQIFNALAPESAVKKFENRDVALRRVGIKIVDIARECELTTYHPVVMSAGDTSTNGESKMPREAKLGPFAQVRADSHIGKIVKAILDSGDEPVTVTEVGALVGLTAEQVVAQLRTARAAKGIGHEVSKESRVVTLVLPAGIDASNVFFQPKAKAASEKKERQHKVGEFKQVRRNSRLGRIVTAAMDNKSTLADVAALAEVTPDEALAHLKSMRRTHGIDHSIENDVVTLAIPDGADPFIAAGEPRPKREASDAPRQGKNYKLDQEAASGVMPEKPIVTSETNKHRQKHFDELAAFAEAGEWDKVAAKHMAGIDSYSAMINRYRDRLLAAHAAQQTRQAAE